VGGTFPQGSFSRYADPGLMANFRISLHIPKVELFVVWADFNLVEFESESFETVHYIYHEVPNGPSWTEARDAEQTTSQNMYAGHIGVQLGSMSQRAFFRPRAALGIGLYDFIHKTEWTEEDADTTITIASETHDAQVSFGWRVMLGADFFISTQWGITVDYIYDHVFSLDQTDGYADTIIKNQIDTKPDLTSRFQGFSVGVVYMFRD